MILVWLVVVLEVKCRGDIGYCRAKEGDDILVRKRETLIYETLRLRCKRKNGKETAGHHQHHLSQSRVTVAFYHVLRRQQTLGMFPCLLSFSVPPSPSRSDSLDRLNKALSSNVGVLEVSDTKVYTDIAGCLSALPDIDISLRDCISVSTELRRRCCKKCLH